jgi:hypothetical protein
VLGFEKSANQLSKIVIITLTDPWTQVPELGGPAELHLGRSGCRHCLGLRRARRRPALRHGGGLLLLEEQAVVAGIDFAKLHFDRKPFEKIFVIKFWTNFLAETMLITLSRVL